MTLTDKEKEINVIKSRIRSCRSDIENLESEIYDYQEQLEELEDRE